MKDFWIDERGPYGICNSKCDAPLGVLTFEAQIKLCGDVVDVTIEIDNRGEVPKASFTCDLPFEVYENGAMGVPDYYDLRLVEDGDNSSESDHS